MSVQPPAAIAASWMDWLLGLDRVTGHRDALLLGWRHELPLWAWVAIVAGAVAIAGFSYAGLVGRGLPKVTLAVVRAVLLIVLAAILTGPVWVEKREQVEPDRLLMLVDRSASMGIQDANTLGGHPAQRVTRHEALRDLVDRHAQLFGPEQLGRDRRLVWLGFDAQAYPIDPKQLGDPPSTVNADGHTTLLRTAIQQALQRASGHPISGVVLFTDGRSPQSTGADLVRELVQQAVSVFPVPLGAAVPSVDLSLARVESPQRAFVNDPVPVSVWIDRYPADAQVDSERLRLRLMDEQTGRVLDDKPLSEDGFDGPVRLVGRSAVAGAASWRVVLTYDTSGTDGPGAATAELITENNQRQIALEFVDRPIRVLYVDGYPRWEYRYLKNALVREKSVLSSVVLISADEGFALEGDAPITRLPQSRDEFQRFDVIIVGDVAADYFSLQQQSLLRDQVAEEGAGLLWIGGADHTPYSYDTTQLSDLLPMRRPRLTEPVVSAGPVTVTPTDQARGLGVLVLREPGEDQSHRNGAPDRWPADLPPLRWIQDIGPLKPSVDVLATAASREAGLSVPLVVRHRYGAGQVVYVASDDTWRWRYGRGDLYFQQFWIQLVRMLGRHRIQEDAQRVRLSLSHQRIELDEAAVVTVHVRDTMLLERRLPSISVAVTAAAGSASGVLERIELVEQPDAAGTAAGTDREHSRVYRAVWRPRHVGTMALVITEPLLSELDTPLRIEVLHPDDELRQPMPDHRRLEVLADLSGGRVVTPDRLEDLASLVPNRARRTPNDQRYPLWNAPVTLVVVLFLLTIEWAGRKLIRLA